jgi:hypothetical protein
MSDFNFWKDKDQVTIKQEKTYKRFSFKTITSELLDFLMVNKGLIYTIKQLTIAPGETLRGYLQTDREKLTGAAKYFVLLVGLFYFVFFQFTHAPYVEGYVEKLEAEGAEEFTIYFQLYFLDQLSIWSALAIFLFAWLSRVFYTKHGLNYTEHVIVHTYINAQMALFKLVSLPSVLLIGNAGYNVIEIFVTLVYYVFVLHHFFREKIGNTLWKSILIIVLGYVLFFMVVLFFWFIFGFFLGLSQVDKG